MGEVRLFSMQVKHWWEKLSAIMLEEGFYSKPKCVGYITAFEHDFRDLLSKVRDLEIENRRLKAVAEAAQELFEKCDYLRSYQGCRPKGTDPVEKLRQCREACPIEKLEQALAAWEEEN